MNQYMPHTFYHIPFNLSVRSTKLFRQHIYGFTNYFHLFHEAKENYRIGLNLFKCESPLVVKDYIY